jgi:hypothetical protein
MFCTRPRTFFRIEFPCRIAITLRVARFPQRRCSASVTRYVDREVVDHCVYALRTPTIKKLSVRSMFRPAGGSPHLRARSIFPVGRTIPPSPVLELGSLSAAPILNPWYRRPWSATSANQTDKYVVRRHFGQGLTPHARVTEVLRGLRRGADAEVARDVF